MLVESKKRCSLKSIKVAQKLPETKDVATKIQKVANLIKLIKRFVQCLHAQKLCVCNKKLSYKSLTTNKTNVIQSWHFAEQ